MGHGILWRQGEAEDRPRIPIISTREFKLNPLQTFMILLKLPQSFGTARFSMFGLSQVVSRSSGGPALEESTAILCMIQLDSAITWQKL